MAFNWISEIWSNLDPDIIKNSFKQCGIVSLNQNNLHSQLRHYLKTNELVDNVEINDGSDEIDGFEEYSDIFE